MRDSNKPLSHKTFAHTIVVVHGCQMITRAAVVCVFGMRFWFYARLSRAAAF